MTTLSTWETLYCKQLKRLLVGGCKIKKRKIRNEHARNKSLPFKKGSQHVTESFCRHGCLDSAVYRLGWDRGNGARRPMHCSTRATLHRCGPIQKGDPGVYLFD